MPLILPGNVASAIGAGYEVANSCRFNDDDSAYMHKTPSTGNRRTFTFSAWIKRGQLSSGTIHLFQPFTDTSNYDAIIFDSSDQLIIKGLVSDSATYTYKTNQKFRDPSAWYHFVVAFDTTDGTAGDRIKLYVNGTEVTSFETETNPDQNLDTRYNLNVVHAVGANGSGAEEFDGYMAEVCFIEGTQYAASDFGEFDEDSPTIWKPIDVSGLTFGTNGFYLDFEDSANLGNDKNGGTDLTEVNLAATDQSSDSPTNNFATLNPLAIPTSAGANTFSEGNLIITNSADAWRTSFSTIGVQNGKWYCEAKFLSGEMKQYIGISKPQDTMDYLGQSANSYGFAGENGRKWNNGSYSAGYGSAASTGDIMMVAFDADNGTIWVGQNGTWFSSATEGEIEAGTTTNAMYSSITIDDFFVVGVTIEDSNVEMNFGNPPYANSSSVSDGNGYGDFEYSVPDGFLSLCTKNLGSTGG